MDPAKAEEFKVRNKKAKQENQHSHNHGHDHGHHHHDHDDDHNHGSCGEHANKYYIAESEMSFVDKTINAKISTDAFFRKNLVVILERAHQAVQSIAVKAKERGMTLEAD